METKNKVITHKNRAGRRVNVEMIPRTKLYPITMENWLSYREYLEYEHVLQSKPYYCCPFCGKCLKYAKKMLRHVEDEHWDVED